MVGREAMVGVVFYLDTGFEPLHPTVLRMSRLEYEALMLRAAQQEVKHDPRSDTITINGEEYTAEYLQWVFETTHPNGVPLTPEKWREARRKREQAYAQERAERARKARERHQREQEERAEQARRAQREQGFFPGPGYNNFWVGDDGSFRFTAGGQTYTGQHKTSTPPPPRTKSNKEKLADLAGVEWSVADNMYLKDLKKKAMRKCHPDTGGSHEKWLELLDLLGKLGIPL